MKIIRISGCCECPYCDWDDSDEDSCFKLKYMCIRTFKIKPEEITNNFKAKTLPDNCPLEDEKWGSILCLYRKEI